MIQSKAADIASQLVLGGYFPVVKLLDSGEYQVAASLETGIDLSVGAGFMKANNILGSATTMTFI